MNVYPDEMKKLVHKLNTYRNAYYNEEESLISDKEYDILYDRLVELEKETGVVFANSPTQTVGYTVVSDLPEVKHAYPPMLSLDKSQEISDMKEFIGNNYALVMAKMDGLTCRLTYVDGVLVRAETRGDGEVGEDITHNVTAIANIPLTVEVTEDFDGNFSVDGEVIVRRTLFARLREKFLDKKGKTYKNPRNYAAGSVRLHDSGKTAERGIEFVAWKFSTNYPYNHFEMNLLRLKDLGFNITPYVALTPSMTAQQFLTATEDIEELCGVKGYPIDGCVFSFDDCAYMESLGYTAHHSRAQKAYKFYDDKYETVIRSIDWTMGKTGILTPTAIFDTVEIDGTDVSRASLHNLTIMQQLNVRQDCTTRVYKANMIIPQVDSVEDDGVTDFIIPDICPVCGGKTARIKDNDSEVLMCMNYNCKGKLLGKLNTFVSKQGLDIDGLGESSLELFIQLGFLTKLSDIFELKVHRHTICALDGWGEHSTDKLLNAIETSKNVTCDKFLAALSIPKIGLTSAKTITKHFHDDISLIVEAFENGFAWSSISGFGEKTEVDIWDWYHDNKEEFNTLLQLVKIRQEELPQTVFTGSKIEGKTFCITGTFEYPRSSMIKELEGHGGISVPSVTKKTDVLFAGDKAGSKLKKAQELGITIVPADEYYDWLGGTFNA